MARKNLLNSLMPDDTATPEAKSASPPPRYTKGAIGAVSRSITDLKNRSVIEIDPKLIKGAGIDDRLEHDEDEHQKLMASIRDHGQQVPVLVRPHPDEEDKYQIVYGRRRVMALMDLGIPVKAMIRDLDDTALIMAQGQENNFRRDLSFIEKANFAHQMTEAGYDRKAITEALNLDKTVISRMLNVMDSLSLDVIRLIGAAPSAGRDRWLELAQLWTANDVDFDLARDMLSAYAVELSDERFNTLLKWLKTRSAPPKKAKRKTKTGDVIVNAQTGKRLAQIKRSPKQVTVTFQTSETKGFEDWLAEHLSELHQDWATSREGGAK